MKGIVMSHEDGGTYVMDHYGSFHFIKSHTRSNIGDEIDFVLVSRSQVYRQIAAIAACLFIAISVSGYAWMWNTIDYYVSIDINPSVELSINKLGKVKESVGVNDDGASLISGISLPRDSKQAIIAIIEAAGENGYSLFDDSGSPCVQIMVAGEDEKAVSFMNIVKENIELMEMPLTVAVEHCSLDYRSAANELGMTAGIYNLCEKILLVDKSEPLNELSKHSVNALSHILTDSEKSPFDSAVPASSPNIYHADEIINDYKYTHDSYIASLAEEREPYADHNIPKRNIPFETAANIAAPEKVPAAPAESLKENTPPAPVIETIPAKAEAPIENTVIAALPVPQEALMPDIIIPEKSIESFEVNAPSQNLEKETEDIPLNNNTDSDKKTEENTPSDNTGSNESNNGGDKDNGNNNGNGSSDNNGGNGDDDSSGDDNGGDDDDGDDNGGDDNGGDDDDDDGDDGDDGDDDNNDDAEAERAVRELLQSADSYMRNANNAQKAASRAADAALRELSAAEKAAEKLNHKSVEDTESAAQNALELADTAFTEAEAAKQYASLAMECAISAKAIADNSTSQTAQSLAENAFLSAESAEKFASDALSYYENALRTYDEIRLIADSTKIAMENGDNENNGNNGNNGNSGNNGNKSGEESEDNADGNTSDNANDGSDTPESGGEDEASSEEDGSGEQANQTNENGDNSLNP